MQIEWQILLHVTHLYDKTRKKMGKSINNHYFLPAEQHLLWHDKVQFENMTVVSLHFPSHLFVSGLVIKYSVSGHYLHISNSPVCLRATSRPCRLDVCNAAAKSPENKMHSCQTSSGSSAWQEERNRQHMRKCSVWKITSSLIIKPQQSNYF